ncbi:hypothetical protein [Paenibacillus contaminans]|uniref:Uncharacterized protein n=1 Tax=Paenibacillus contaminans TaxID=450362 RepID=A0A329MIV6_9BACL|nr:hypothetical protein [Paenibacillus contaminans]RAV19498.1 hypothetical protein DQG23_21155 [Paenibacillus contaminans]
MDKQVYMTRFYGNGDGRFEADAVYLVRPELADTMLAEGAAVLFNYPTLSEFGRKVNVAVDAYRKHAKQLEENVVLEPLEKQIQVCHAQKVLADRIEDIRSEHEVEYKAQKLIAAQEAFKIAKVTDEAREFADSIVLELRATGNGAVVAEMLESAIPVLSPEQKAAVLQRMPEIRTEAGKDADKFGALIPGLADNAAQMQYRQLQAYGRNANPATAYDTLKIVHHTYKPGYLSAEVWGQVSAQKSGEDYRKALEGDK